MESLGNSKCYLVQGVESGSIDVVLIADIPAAIPTNPEPLHVFRSSSSRSTTGAEASIRNTVRNQSKHRTRLNTHDATGETFKQLL